MSPNTISPLAVFQVYLVQSKFWEMPVGHVTQADHYSVTTTKDGGITFQFIGHSVEFDKDNKHVRTVYKPKPERALVVRTNNYLDAVHPAAGLTEVIATAVRIVKAALPEGDGAEVDEKEIETDITVHGYYQFKNRERELVTLEMTDMKYD